MQHVYTPMLDELEAGKRGNDKQERCQYVAESTTDEVFTPWLVFPRTTQRALLWVCEWCVGSWWKLSFVDWTKTVQCYCYDGVPALCRSSLQTWHTDLPDNRITGQSDSTSECPLTDLTRICQVLAIWLLNGN